MLENVSGEVSENLFDLIITFVLFEPSVPDGHDHAERGWRQPCKRLPSCNLLLKHFKERSLASVAKKLFQMDLGPNHFEVRFMESCQQLRLKLRFVMVRGLSELLLLLLFV